MLAIMDYFSDQFNLTILTPVSDNVCEEKKHKKRKNHILSGIIQLSDITSQGLSSVQILNSRPNHRKVDQLRWPITK